MKFFEANNITAQNCSHPIVTQCFFYQNFAKISYCHTNSIEWLCCCSNNFILFRLFVIFMRTCFNNFNRNPSVCVRQHISYTIYHMRYTQRIVLCSDGWRATYLYCSRCWYFILRCWFTFSTVCAYFLILCHTHSLFVFSVGLKNRTDSSSLL